MKRLFFMIAILLLAAGCGGNGTTYDIENEPYYKEGEPTEIILFAEEDSGDAFTGLDIIGILEMEKMDHGTIEVIFTENGDGTYVGEAELPMGGKWVMQVKAEKDGEEYEHLIRLDISEG